MTFDLSNKVVDNSSYKYQYESVNAVYQVTAPGLCFASFG
jgi:hypothetical protein